MLPTAMTPAVITVGLIGRLTANAATVIAGHTRRPNTRNATNASPVGGQSGVTLCPTSASRSPSCATTKYDAPTSTKVTSERRGARNHRAAVRAVAACRMPPPVPRSHRTSPIAIVTQRLPAVDRRPGPTAESHRAACSVTEMLVGRRCSRIFSMWVVGNKKP